MAINKTTRKIFCYDQNGIKINDLKLWKSENYNKVYFDSKFEFECYKLLSAAKFDVDFNPPSRELMPSFKSWSLSRAKGKTKFFESTVRNISYTPDFIIKCNSGILIIVESKGFFRPDARMRLKICQSQLKKNERLILIFDTPTEGLKSLKELIDIINNDLGGSTVGPPKEIVINKNINI